MTPDAAPQLQPPEEPECDVASLHDALERHRRALRSLTAIQRAISARAPLQDVLDAIVEAARDLLGDEQPALFLTEPDDSEVMRLVASCGIDDELLEEIRRRPVGVGVAGQAVAMGHLTVVEDYSNCEHGTVTAFRARGLSAAMAAPVHEDGRVIGALLVSTYVPGRHYSQGDRELLTALAEHASLALNDARMVASMAYQALHDPLTALPNRALFADRLTHTLGRARRTGGTAAVLFCDLDRFKTVNDTLGHAVGDALLGLVAQRVQACLRAGDTAARLGGDEFAVLVEDVDDAGEALVVAERLLTALRRPFSIAGRELLVSASIGVALATGADDADLLRRADTAMYRAKADGRGRAVMFEPAMRQAGPAYVLRWTPTPLGELSNPQVPSGRTVPLEAG